jgi:carbon monoxide dehydrogenase subunit G
MPTTRRTRALAAAPDAVWRVAGDANHLPRWWPRVQRVENVTEEEFTAVYGTSKGRPVRGDYRVVAHEPPRRRHWAQRIEGSPFERFVREFETIVEVEPAGAGSEITLTVIQKLRGLSRTGGFLAKRAMRRQLDEALDRLEALV